MEQCGGASKTEGLVVVGKSGRVSWLLVQLGRLSGVVQPGEFGGCWYLLCTTGCCYNQLVGNSVAAEQLAGLGSC